jgi:nucleoid-associated protein YgaU
VAVRQEDLLVREALVYRFPSHMLHARRAHRRMVARRRLTLGVVTVVMAIAFLVAGGPEGTATASKAGAPRTVTVHQGDTLWGLAERYAPDSVDPRAYVAALGSLNSLRGPIHPGMRLKLP